MIIKKYLANDLNTAVELVKQELGPDAVVLTTRHVRSNGFFGWFASNKVEVTVAIEEAQLKKFNETKLSAVKNAKGSQKEKKGTTSAPVQASESKSSARTGSDGEELNQELEKLKRAFSGNESMGSQGDKVTLSSKAQAYTPSGKNRATPTATPTNDRERGQQNNLAKFERGLLSTFGGSVSGAEERSNTGSNLAKTRNSEQEKGAKRGTEAEELRQIIREEMMRAQGSVSVGPIGEENSEEVVGSVKFLMAKGLSRKNALEIHETLNEKCGLVDLTQPSHERTNYINAMKGELVGRMQTTGPLQFKSGEATVMALVGPTGVGKTTTLAKVAAHFKNQRKRVAIISLDTQKLGAREQIQALANKLQTPFEVVDTPQKLQRAVREFADADLILIDTAGQSQYQDHSIDQLQEMLSSIPQAHVALTVSAATKDIDIFGAVRKFAPLKLASLIFTKLDETIAYGVMVNVSYQTGLPIEFLTTGQSVPGDLELAEKSDIAKRILIEHNDARSMRLRQLAG
jgi:flagellar biosynthesis protein FlhF